METSTLLAIIIPCGFICVICLLIGGLFAFVKTRRKPLRVLVPVTYTPKPNVVTVQIRDFQSPMSKRDKRKERIKYLMKRDQFRAARKEIFKKLQAGDPVDAGDEMEDHDIEEGPEELDATMEGSLNSDDHQGTLRSSLLSKAMRRVSGFFSLRSSLKPTASEPEPAVPESSDEDIMAAISSVVEAVGAAPSPGRLRKSLSPQRMEKVEKRRQSIMAKKTRYHNPYDSMVMENVDEDEDHIVNIMTVDQVQQIQRDRLIGLRKDKRHQQKLALLRQGKQDPVVINSGPPTAKVPANYQMVEFIDDISPAFLTYKRIMYHMEFAEDYKPSGWYIATIVQVSKQADCNFNIKFDRAETGTLFVDGVHSVMLALEGPAAYGRRWVVVDRLTPFVSDPDSRSAQFLKSRVSSKPSSPAGRSRPGSNKPESPGGLTRRLALGLGATQPIAEE